MTNQEAKQILALHRPGVDDADQNDVAEALALSRRDPALGAWLEERVALFTAIQTRLKQIEPPPGGKERILSLSQAPIPGPPWRRPRTRPLRLAIAALIVSMLGLTLCWLSLRPSSASHRFTVYRQRMVHTALQNYARPLLTNDLNEIRAYLARNSGHGDYLLTKPLASLPGDGCAILRWHDRTVSLVCFEIGNQQDLYLFIIDRADLSDPPGPSRNQPQFATIGRFATAGWSEGGKTYLLAGPGDEKFLRRFL
jgi:hypothetical protein